MERDLDEILSKIQEHVAQEEATGYLEIHLENYHWNSYVHVASDSGVHSTWLAGQ